MPLIIEINGLPARTNNNGGHWSRRMKEAKLWRYKTATAALIGKADFKPSPFPLSKAKLTLTRYSSTEPDFDGLVSSFKHCIDGLKDAGIILDDKMSVIGQPEYKWELAKPRKGKIRIEVVAA